MGHRSVRHPAESISRLLHNHLALDVGRRTAGVNGHDAEQKMSETNDVRERLQEVARTIAVILPPGTGFVLLAFDFTPGGRLEYVANAKREDVLQMLHEFIRKNESPEVWAKHSG
jgi:hypothetical protein